jgi:hypothetical protein
MHVAINLALDFNITTADLEKIGTGNKGLRLDTEARRLVGLAHGYRLQIRALREEAMRDDGSRRWGSACDFTQKLTRFICCIEADFRAPVPPAAPLPSPTKANPQTKANILVCAAQWRAYLLARGRT